MKKHFVSEFCNLHAVKIPPAVLKTIYSELTLDASMEQNKQVENRIREAILAEDADLVTDLRHINTGRLNNTFDTFCDKLSEVVEEITAADDRRQNVEHMSHFVSVRDLMKQATDKVPNGTNIPSESTVLLAFVPRDSHKNVSKLYKSKIPLHKLVERSTHNRDVQPIRDRQYAVKYRDSLSFLCVDDKSTVEFGEPGLKVATGVRGKKPITQVQSTLSALDHDMQSKGSFTPCVCLEVNVPHKTDESFYRVSVHVTYTDSIFQASSPWRHAIQIAKMLGDKAEVPECLILYSDCGPDHRITYGSVKLSLIVLFKKLNLDMLVAARTAPGHSWLNPAEHIMSILNIAVQNVAFSRENVQVKLSKYSKVPIQCLILEKKHSIIVNQKYVDGISQTYARYA
ncbi:unnamed protein product [Mytilus coruscus]|uniref:Uncharacterized protein n=1 Tax=Mytilus coruscus TaxID=42192 RepID=A0A6J8EPJ5_MYTCO|nr:unnamed protein product [Mytilus coruscus]